MNKGINVWSYLAAYKRDRKSILGIVDNVFSSGQLIAGREVKKLEHAFARYCNCEYGVSVNSGTDALFLALKALGITRGDEVITVPNTAIPTVSAIATTGATPVFVDIKPDTYVMDVTRLEQVITKRTKCIVPVHLYGQCVDMDAVSKIAKKHNLFVLEDCAQATGATWRGKIAGSMSDIAAFSFYPTKVLGAYGDGGMIVTRSQRLAKRCSMLQMYGIRREYYSEFLGYYSRLDEVQAAILSYKFKKLDRYIEKRRTIAMRYRKTLYDTPLKLPNADPDANHVYYLFVCRYHDRDELIAYLKKRGITINVSYRHPLHTMRGFKYLGYKHGDFPVTERASRQIFSLPMYPELSVVEQEKVITALHNFFVDRRNR